MYNIFDPVFRCDTCSFIIDNISQNQGPGGLLRADGYAPQITTAGRLPENHNLISNEYGEPWSLKRGPITSNITYMGLA